MYSNDVQWLSQNIYTHRDKVYGTNGFMRVSMSTNTKDSLSFSAPTFVINIQNDSLNKTVSLSYQKLFELYGRLKDVVGEAAQEYQSKEGNPESQLHYKTGKSVFLTFDFLRGSQQNEPIVRIRITHGTSDSTSIIMPFSPEFHSFISLIGDMVGNRKYLDWCLHFPNRFYMIEMNEVIKQMPGLIKNAVVQMDRMQGDEPPPPQSSEPSIKPEVDTENTNEVLNMLRELDSFVGDDMNNIDLTLPANLKLESKPATGKDISDNKLLKWLKGDLKNMEKIVSRCSEKSTPVREFEIELNQNYYDMECFPGIDPTCQKSMIYLSTRVNSIIKMMLTTQSVSQSMPIFRYNGYEKSTPKNIEMAHDLLFSYIFIKLCRDKIENKTNDNYLNKSFVNLASSICMSPFIFSFIKEGTDLKSILVDKYNQFNEVGAFDSYKNDEFKTYGFDLTQRDFGEAGERLEEFINSKNFPNDAHMKHVTAFSHDKCALNPDNTLNEEQITNHVIPIELYIIQNDVDIKLDQAKIKSYANENGHNDSDVLKTFVKFEARKTIPIVKFFENNLAEIPENIRNDFMKSITEYTNKDFDFKDKTFPYDSFGEIAIKALFLWKPETGKKFKTYKKFCKAIVETNQDKETILSMSEHVGENTDSGFGSVWGKGE